MKTLSVKQPWAWLICAGYKDVENRTWKTNYRGRILIHASRNVDPDTACILSRLERQKMIDWETYCSYPYVAYRQAIIGEVTIIDCVKNHKSEWAEPDCWNWVLADPVLYDKPIQNVKGKLGLWEYET